MKPNKVAPLNSGDVMSNTTGFYKVFSDGQGNSIKNIESKL